MARGAAGRVAAGALLPRLRHLTGAGRGDRVPEQARGLRILVRAAADAMRDIAADPKHLGTEIAVTLLHTWGTAGKLRFSCTLVAMAEIRRLL
jgi:hypothetical protein